MGHSYFTSGCRRMWSSSIVVLQIVLTRAVLSGRKVMAPERGLGAWSTANEQPWASVNTDWSAWNDFPTSGPGEFSPHRQTQGLPTLWGKWRLCPAQEGLQMAGVGNHNWENPYVGGRNTYQKNLYSKKYLLQKGGLHPPVINKIPKKKLKIWKETEDDD